MLSLQWLLWLKLLLLLIAANGSPVLVKRLAGGRWGWPIDRGWRLRDGRPLLGASKTWRGVAAACVSTTLVALLVGLPGLFGCCFGAASMLGDLLSSFSKRRLGLASSARATGLDQLPEAMLPLIGGKYWLNYDWWPVVVVTALFVVLEMAASPLLYRLGVRNRPY